MKNFTLAALLLIIGIASANAQTVYDIKENISLSSIKFPEQCDKCVINISEGVTLTIDKDVYLMNTTFNGGNVVVNGKKVTFWADGAFNNTNVSFNKVGGLVSSGALTILNSTFIFNNNTTATLWATLDMTASSFKFLDNASMEATAKVNLNKVSSLVAGDGAANSKSFLKFNGGTLTINDKSFVTMMNSNNYYFNWSNYNTSGKSIQTTNSKMNCGIAGKNSCEAPVVYGPLSLTPSGMSSFSTLPVKLSAFAVKLNGTSVILTWTTDMEQNSSRFEIERSADGINWKTIGSVNAKGNSSVAVKYAFNDAVKINGSISYRLKMIDQDASSEYSVIKTVKTASAIEMNIYPNPATDFVVINAKNATEKLYIQLIGFNGQVLKQVNGSGNVQMNVNEFKTGNYVVRVVDTIGNAQAFKLIVKK